ncbi:MAG: glycine/betaine/sarcosine/D-proline family reductase selenoprotein B [Aminobacterium sp.]|uniref:glycine/betaine/sarcosine/D-proline family reductase selenoprotein B n=1 Tax=Aminobacterium sp. TaxID=1872491 RepID=UPI001BCE9E8E|nr:glycine/betaine/sarcosine/D-proline family reductase selenoprotein B [Aminobacterium sp.]MEA4876621.1 glycine/betaine/sarcosine/D-proline family reductase selenoprotein B [Aminobacterium sp.]
MADQIKVVFYMNQFFAGIGGEEKADQIPIELEELKGPALALSQVIKESNAEIVKTVVCGDSFFGENEEQAKKELLGMIKAASPDIFLASPAFGSGRNGVATASICSAVTQELGIPAVTAMYPDNPGSELVYPAYALPTSNRAEKMINVLEDMWNFALKVKDGEVRGSAARENYIPRGVRKNEVDESTAAERVLPLLLSKIKGEAYVTEVALPKHDAVEAPKPVTNMKKATLALVTEGSLVPFGNPDKLESWWGEHWYKYSIEGLDDFEKGKYETIHAGFENANIDDDPDRLLPLDVARIAEKEGRIGKLFDIYLTTTGMETATSSAKRMGREMAEFLRSEGVDAAIVTGT